MTVLSDGTAMVEEGITLTKSLPEDFFVLFTKLLVSGTGHSRRGLATAVPVFFI